MATQKEKQMLKDFGFNSESDLNLMIDSNNPVTVQRLWKNRDFKWRIKFLSKYHKSSGQRLSIASKIKVYFDTIENSALKHCSGGYAYTSSTKVDKQYQYLTSRLVKPWKITLHRNLLFSIKDPNNIFHFKAIDFKQLKEALDICCKMSKRNGAKTKPWILSLKWNECLTSYKHKRKNCSTYWVGKDYDIALLICDNIISNWNTKTGDWKPWNIKWCKLAHRDLSHSIKHRQFRHHGTSSIVKGLNSISTTKVVTYNDISNWVFKKGFKGMKQAAFILAVAVGVGGARAAKIINGFREQYGIQKW